MWPMALWTPFLGTRNLLLIMDVSTDPIRITDGLAIPRRELAFTTARAGGPGGQHVNTTATAVTLIFNVAQSPSLTDFQRARLLLKLENRINQEGELRLTARSTRSQAANKEQVIERFARLLTRALYQEKPRHKTKVPRRAKEKRLEEKRKQGEKKRERGRLPL